MYFQNDIKKGLKPEGVSDHTYVLIKEFSYSSLNSNYSGVYTTMIPTINQHFTSLH